MAPRFGKPVSVPATTEQLQVQVLQRLKPLNEQRAPL
jgi:hypothetical protein